MERYSFPAVIVQKILDYIEKQPFNEVVQLHSAISNEVNQQNQAFLTRQKAVVEAVEKKEEVQIKK